MVCISNYHPLSYPFRSLQITLSMISEREKTRIKPSISRVVAGILRDKTMDDKLIYIPIDDKLNYTFYRLELIEDSNTFNIKLIKVPIFIYCCYITLDIQVLYAKKQYNCIILSAGCLAASACKIRSLF